MSAPDQLFPRFRATNGRSIAEVNGRIEHEYGITPGRLAMWKELVWEIGIDRLPEMIDQSLEAEIELAAKRMVPGAVTGLLFDRNPHGPVLLRRAGAQARQNDLELTPDGIRLLRRIAEEYEPA